MAKTYKFKADQDNIPPISRRVEIAEEVTETKAEEKSLQDINREIENQRANIIRIKENASRQVKDSEARITELETMKTEMDTNLEITTKQAAYEAALDSELEVNEEQA